MKVRSEGHGSVSTGPGIQFALLVTALLFSVPTFAADSKGGNLHPDEINFVAPSATTRLSKAERCISLGDEEILSDMKARCPSHKPVENAEIMSGEPRASYPSEFLARTSPRMIVDNPYLSLDRGFFNKIRGTACNPNTSGELWVTATASLKRNNNPYASGIWRVAPEGQITALAAKPWALETSRLYMIRKMTRDGRVTTWAY